MPEQYAALKKPGVTREPFTCKEVHNTGQFTVARLTCRKHGIGLIVGAVPLWMLHYRYRNPGSDLALKQIIKRFALD